MGPRNGHGDDVEASDSWCGARLRNRSRFKPLRPLHGRDFARMRAHCRPPLHASLSDGSYSISEREISLLAVRITGALATLTVVNLAIGGLGLPFAAALSRKVATRWLYSRCRNPMGFYGLLCAIAGAVWLRSPHALLWTILWLAPAWILFVKFYEERELEIRFGEPYLQCKARTPFFGF